MSEVYELKDVIQLKKYLQLLKSRGELIQADYSRLNQELDLVSFSLVEDVELEMLPDTLGRIKSLSPTLPLHAFEPVLKRHRIQQIRALRTAAEEQGLESFECKLILDQQLQIPLSNFSWQELAADYKQLVLTLSNHLEDEQLFLQTVNRFMVGANKEQFFLGLSSLNSSVLTQLNTNRLIGVDDFDILKKADNEIRNSLVDRQQTLTALLLRPKAHKLEDFSVLERFHALFNTLDSGDLSNLVLEQLAQWRGPEIHTLFDKALAKFPRSQQLGEVVLARVGIDPNNNRSTWLEWVNTEKSKTKIELALWHEELSNNNYLFDSLLNIALAKLSERPNETEKRWYHIAKSLLCSSKADLPVSAYSAVNKMDTASRVQATEDIEALEEVLEIDEVETLAAPNQRLSVSDKIVFKHSSWNEYVKPFLSENWLGLIGISLIIAAWPMLSIMVWDMGPYYRLAAGATPLLCLTLGFAWVTQFFAKMNNPDWDRTGELLDFNRKPVQLFICLTTWTLPFNYLMAVSLFNAESYLVGGLLLVVYTSIVLAIKPWLACALESRQQKYLWQSHLVLLLPIACANIHLEWLSFGLASLSFGLYFLLAFQLIFQAKATKNFARGFYTLLFTVHAFLLFAVTHIYYREVPSLYTFALLSEFAALTLLYFYNNSATKPTNYLIVGGALTFLGGLLALDNLWCLLAVLCLSGAYWYQLFLRAKKLQGGYSWVGEVFASHSILIAICLYYLLQLHALGALTLMITSLVVLSLIEYRIVRVELKQISFLLPISLLMAATIHYEGVWLSSFILVILLIAGLWYYFRAQRLYSPLLWYTGVTTLVCLPILLFEAAFSSALLSVYLSLVCFAWSVSVKPIGTGLGQQHHSSVLWGLLIASLCVTLIHVVEQGLALHWSLFASLVCLAVAALLAAKRTQSALPVYLFLVVVSILGLSAKQAFGIHSKSGLGSACLALILVAAAPWLQQRQFLKPKAVPDRFFNRPFWFFSQYFIRHPIEQASWLLVGISFVKSLAQYSPTMDNVSVSAALLLQTVVIILLAIRYSRAWLAALSLLPLGLLCLAVIASFADQYRGVLVLTTLIGFNALYEWLTRKQDSRMIFVNAYQVANKALSILFIPVALLFYPYAIVFGVSEWLIPLFTLLTCFYIHSVFVKAGSFAFIHLAILHLLLIAALGIGLFFEDFVVQEPLRWSLYFVLVLFLVLFLVAYALEWFDNQFAAAYRERTQVWLWSLAIIMLVIIIFPLVESALPESSLLGAAYHSLGAIIISVICMHLANRYYHGYPMFVAKWLALGACSYSITNSLFVSTFGAVMLFLLVELLWHGLSKARLLQLQGVNDNWKTPIEKIAHVALLGIVGICLSHWYGLMFYETSLESPYWLVLLLPLSAFVYSRLRWAGLAYLVAGSLVYANIFIALGWQQVLTNYGLSSIHFVTMGLLFSVLCFAGVLKLSSRAINPERGIC